MARDIDFNAFNNEQLLSKVQGVTDRLKELKSAVNESNKELKAMELAIDNVQDNFREVNRVAKSYNKLQSEAQKSSTSLSKIIENRATIEQNIFSLNSRLNKLYLQQLDVEKDIDKLTKDKLRNLEDINTAEENITKLKQDYGKLTKQEQQQIDDQIKDQREIINQAKEENTVIEDKLNVNKDILEVTGKQGANLTAVKDEANLVLDVYENLENSTEQLNKKTGSFVNYVSRILNDIPGLRQLTEPFEEGLVAYRKQLVVNEKIRDINLRTGEGLTEQKIFELGLAKDLTDEHGNLLTGQDALNKLRDEGLITSIMHQGALTKGFMAMGSAISKSLLPLAIITAAVNAIRGIFSVIGGSQTRSVELARQFGISRDAADQMRFQLERSEISINKSYATMTKLIEAQTMLVNELDRGGTFMEGNLEAITLMTQRLGVSEEAATKVAARAEAFGQNSRLNVETIQNMNNELYNSGQSTATFSQLMNSVSEATGQVAASFGFSNTAIAKAVNGVRRMGLNLLQARNISEGLLDFEKSISAELEAELFLGRDINLDKARMMSLQGDIVGATSEVMKITKGLTAEQRRSPVIMGALADVIGLSVDELQDAYLLETDRARQGREQIKNYKEYLALVKDHRKTIQFTINEEKELEDLLAKQTDKQTTLTEQEKERLEVLTDRKKELDEVLKTERIRLGIADTTATQLGDQVTAGEQLAAAMQRLKDKFVELVGTGAIDKLTVMLQRIAEGGILSALSGVRDYQIMPRGTSSQEEVDAYLDNLVKTRRFDQNMLTTIRAEAKKEGFEDKLDNYFNEQQNIVKDLTTITTSDSRSGQKTTTKRSRGDILTNLDTKEIAELKIAEAVIEVVGQKNVDDFISRGNTITPFRKDDIVIGGTNLLGGEYRKSEKNIDIPDNSKAIEKTNMLLEKLIAEVSKGGNVYIDGNKAGRAMVLATQKLS